MLNPSDSSTLRAMVAARQEELRDLSRKNEISRQMNQPGVPEFHRVSPVRRSIGFKLMRTGARIAGICLQPELSRQL